MTSNRNRALNAAIDIIATQGIRALTHRHVDERAGLPEGSTSNVFRTRDALLLGVTEHMVAVEMPTVAESLEAVSPDQLIDSLVALFERQTGPLRTQTAARFALFVEAGHDEAIRTVLSQGRSVIISPIRSAFVTLGARDPDLAVQLVSTCFEGLFLHVLAHDGNIDARPIITSAVRAALLA